MVCTPGFRAVGGAGISFGEGIDSLEHNFGGYYTFVFAQYFFAEVSLEILADYEHYFAEAGADSVVHRVVHDSFAVGAEAVELLETSVAAAHSGSKYK